MHGVMAILVTFLLGIVNFTLHKAVLASRHALLDQMPAFMRRLDGRASLMAEFALLLGALLLVANGRTGWSLAYLCYSLLNGVSAWAILKRKV